MNPSSLQKQKANLHFDEPTYFSYLITPTKEKVFILKHKNENKKKGKTK